MKSSRSRQTLKSRPIVHGAALSFLACAFIYIGILPYNMAYAQTAPAPSLTAFQAKQIAGANVSEPDKVIQISGVRNSMSIYPTSWRILFWDAKSEQNGKSVTVAGNAITEIKDGYVELDKMRLAAYKLEEILPAADLVYDSNHAVNQVVAAAKLQNVVLSSVEFLLQKDKTLALPVWKLTLYATGSGKEVEIGQAHISAKSGEIIELKLDVKKLLP